MTAITGVRPTLQVAQDLNTRPANVDVEGGDAQPPSREARSSPPPPPFAGRIRLAGVDVKLDALSPEAIATFVVADADQPTASAVAPNSTEWANIPPARQADIGKLVSEKVEELKGETGFPTAYGLGVEMGGGLADALQPGASPGPLTPAELRYAASLIGNQLSGMTEDRVKPSISKQEEILQGVSDGLLEGAAKAFPSDPSKLAGIEAARSAALAAMAIVHRDKSPDDLAALRTKFDEQFQRGIGELSSLQIVERQDRFNQWLGLDLKPEAPAAQPDADPGVSQYVKGQIDAWVSNNKIPDVTNRPGFDIGREAGVRVVEALQKDVSLDLGFNLQPAERGGYFAKAMLREMGSKFSDMGRRAEVFRGLGAEFAYRAIVKGNQQAHVLANMAVGVTSQDELMRLMSPESRRRFRVALGQNPETTLAPTPETTPASRRSKRLGVPVPHTIPPQR